MSGADTSGDGDDTADQHVSLGDSPQVLAAQVEQRELDQHRLKQLQQIMQGTIEALDRYEAMRTRLNDRLS